MTNEEKARELTMCEVCSVVCGNNCLTYQNLIRIAKWKDQQYQSKIEQLEKDLVRCKELDRINFWKRLQMFVSDVTVCDMPGEEEKEMILSVCNKNLKNE